MAVVDPTYPLYPIACMLAAVLLLLLIFSCFVRRSYNLGVLILCFWLSLETFTEGSDAVIWSDNADIRLHIYCDIVSRLQTACYVAKPAATLIMARQLHSIACFRPVGSQSLAAIRTDPLIAYILGIFIPVLVAGPLYYIVETARFKVLEGFGCTGSSASTGLSIILVSSWSAVFPLISIVCFYPRVLWTFYRQRKDIEEFLCSSGHAQSDTRLSYIRLLALASIDIILTLPIGITNVVLVLVKDLEQGSLPFYSGWTAIHSNWAPISDPYSDIRSGGMADLAQFYFSNWTSPVLAFAIFGLFGLTTEARGSYRRMVHVAAGRIGLQSSKEPGPPVEKDTAMVFGARSRATSVDIELGVDMAIEAQPRYTSGQPLEPLDNASRESSNLTLVGPGQT